MESILFAQLGTIIAVVFSAGILWNKVNNIEKKLHDYEERGQRLSRLEALLKAKN